MRKIRVPGEGTFVAADDLDAASVAEALRRHRTVQDSARVLKRASDRLITRVSVPAVAAGASRGDGVLDAVVKERRLPLRWRLTHGLGFPSRFASGPGKVSRLERAGIHAPRVLAASLRVRHGADFLITEYVSGVSLLDLLWHGAGRLHDPQEIRALLSAVGEWMRAMHERGIWHRDMKCDNVIARPRIDESPELFLVDFSDVRFFLCPVDMRRRSRNLSQLLDLPAWLEPSARSALFHGYLKSELRLDAELLEARVDALLASLRSERRRLRGHTYIDEELPPSPDSRGP